MDFLLIEIIKITQLMESCASSFSSMYCGEQEVETIREVYLSLVINGTVHDLTPFTIRTTNKTGKSDFASSLFTDNLIAWQKGGFHNNNYH